MLKRSERYFKSFERKLTENDGTKSIQSDEQEKVDISSTDISSTLNINSWVLAIESDLAECLPSSPSAMKSSRGLSKYWYTFLMFQSEP